MCPDSKLFTEVSRFISCLELQNAQSEDELRSVLKEYFGFPEFHPGQLEALKLLLAEKVDFTLIGRSLHL